MRNFVEGFILAASMALVAGCGGTGSRSLEDFSPTPQAPDFKSISGNVQGLTGILTLGWGSQTQVLTGGVFDIGQAFESGDDVVLSIVNEPASQRCTIDSQTVFNGQGDNIAGVMISCVTQNLIRISVINFSSGAPFPGVDVTATWNVQGSQQTLAGVSDALGLLTFEVPTFNGRIVVNAASGGFGEQSKIVTNTAIPAGRIARMLMQPVVLGTTFDATVGTALTVGTDVLLTIPANAFVDSNGNIYNGTVNTELTAPQNRQMLHLPRCVR